MKSKILKTGNKALDILTRGIRSTDLVYLIEEAQQVVTSMLLADICKTGKTVLYFCPSAQLSEVGMAVLSYVSAVPAGRLSKGQLEKSEWKTIALGANQMATLKMFNKEYNANELQNLSIAITRSIKSLPNVAIVIVRLPAIIKGQKAEVFSKLKVLAKKKKIPILVSQEITFDPLNCKSKHQERLQLGSHQIKAGEPYADHVWIHEAPRNIKFRYTQIVVVKNRHGETGVVEVSKLKRKTVPPQRTRR